MTGIRKTFLILFIVSLVLSLFYAIAFASEIEIKPVLEGENYYTMKFGETQTFEASGFGWDEANEKRVPGVEIEAIRWSFDSRFLESVGEGNKTITLKAIKERTSKLTVTGKVGTKYATKTIFIVIK